MSMFCYQCQEAAKGTGCTIKGICGKNDEVSALQDLLVFVAKGISYYSTKAREIGYNDTAINNYILESLFITITNANFDPKAIKKKIALGLELREKAKEALLNNGKDLTNLPNAALWNPTDETEYLKKATTIGILSEENEDIRSLKELTIYGLKGLAAYGKHAANLGFEKEEIHAALQKILAELLKDDLTQDELIRLVMETGAKGVDVMGLLDEANTTTYGDPEITEVNIGVRNNPAILISGHDLKDMEELLKQTEGTGVDVYTHSEMLPANYYPAFKKYKHFVGNYGNAWWKQNTEFETFNGPILFTTNCITPPKESYKNRVYTTGESGFEGITHIPEGSPKDFSAIIEHAKKLPSPTQIEEGTIIGGFAHHQVLSLADKIVDAVKSGAIKKFIVMAGCDGRHASRKYYSEFAEHSPKDSVILTAGCAKYRYNKLNLGDIGGIPRVLDAGQCNDSYSLAVIALKLKQVFGLEDINDLPIVYNIAWYEQKAVIVFLALLSLGVKNIHLGPTLPAFLSPNVAKVLVKTFGIGGITDVEADLQTMFA